MMKYIKTFENDDYLLYFELYSEKFSHDLKRLTTDINRMNKDEIDFDIFYNGEDENNNKFFSLWTYPNSDKKEKMLKYIGFAAADKKIKNKNDVRQSPSNFRYKLMSEDDLLAYIAAKKYNL